VVRGLMSDEEWAFFEPFLSGAAKRTGRPPANHRLVLDGIFWIARTGAPWRDLHEDFGSWNSVYRQFRRWTLAGIWDVMLEALNDSGAGQASLQMIDSTIVRAHQHAGGAKKGGLKQALKRKILDAREVASRPRSTSGPMPWVSPSR
jgi:transposase